MRDPGGGFCLGNPTREGEKEDEALFCVGAEQRNDTALWRKGCDFAVLRTRYGIPPPRFNPDGAGPAARQTRGNEAPLLFSPNLELPLFAARLGKLGLRPLSNSVPMELSPLETPAVPLPWPGAVFPGREMEEEPGDWPLLCILGTGVRKRRK